MPPAAPVIKILYAFDIGKSSCVWQLVFYGLFADTAQIYHMDEPQLSLNIDKPLGAESRTFQWSLKHDASGAAMLCLSARPFQFTEKTDPVCYRKAK